MSAKQMKIYLTDQQDKFTDHLARLLSVPVMPYDIAVLKEKVTKTQINTGQKFEGIDLEFLSGYRIFPANIMSGLTQWAFEKRGMRPGDTIVQQVFIPPIKRLSQKIIFGVRIKDVIDEPCRKGYSYETLEGHVERGISTFMLEKTTDGKLFFVVQTFSEPANFLTKLLGPVFSVPYQTYCTRQALRNVRKIIESQKG